MSNLIYRTSYGLSTGVVNGQIEVEDTTLKIVKERYKNNFEIQVFGHDIHPKEARSPLFRCRNLVANIGCVYIGQDRSSVIAAHLDEACNIVKDTNKDLVVIECVTFDTGCEEVSEVLNALYNIVANEAKTHFGAIDVVVYWDLNDCEIEIVKDNTDWYSNGTVNFNDSRFGYIVLQA